MFKRNLSGTTHLVQSDNETFVLTPDRRAFSRRFKETPILIIILMGFQESRLVPAFHRGRSDVEPLAKLRQGEHPTISQPIIARNKTIGFLDITDVHPRKRPPIDRMHSLMAQDSGDLVMGIVVKQSVNFGHDVSGVFTQLADGWRKRPSERLSRPSLEANVTGAEGRCLIS